MSGPHCGLHTMRPSSNAVAVSTAQLYRIRMNQKIPKPQVGSPILPGVTDKNSSNEPESGTHRSVRIGNYRGKRPWSPDKAAARFWSRIDRSQLSPGGCWPWSRGHTTDGYGRIWFAGRDAQAHRVAWELANGPIQPGLVVRHKACDNRLCSDVAHMLLGSIADNIQDMVEKKRHAHGARVGGAKLTPVQIDDIRCRFRSGATRYLLAHSFGVTHRTICYIVRGERWKDVA
jgi:hypothetical protein